MKSKSLILMVVSLGFGLIAAIGIGQVMGRGGGGEDAPKMTPVLVAIDQLAIHSKLSEENVRIDHWPASIVPEEACADLSEVDGQAVTIPVAKGMPILKKHMDSEANLGRLPIPKGFKVVAIKVSGDDTINGLLRPGDKIDVIGVFKTKDQVDGEKVSVAKTFLTNVTCFSVNDTYQSSGSRLESGTGSSSNSIVGVLLNTRQSEQLVLVQKVAQLKLILRGDGIDDSESDLANIDEELEQYINPKLAKKVDDEDQDDRNFSPAEYSQPVSTGPKHKITIWNGSDPVEFSFQDGRMISSEDDAPAPFGGASGSGSRDDYKASPESSDLDRDLEEDEYLEE